MLNSLAGIRMPALPFIAVLAKRIAVVHDGNRVNLVMSIRTLETLARKIRRKLPHFGYDAVGWGLSLRS